MKLLSLTKGKKVSFFILGRDTAITLDPVQEADGYWIKGKLYGQDREHVIAISKITSWFEHSNNEINRPED